MLKLAIKPAPLDDECPVSYALRAALNNGYLYITSMIRPSQVNRLSKLHHSGAHVIDEVISFDSTFVDAHINNPLCKYNLAIEPKVCIECIQESQLVTNKHQSLFSFFCQKHHIPLIDTCPSCNERLTWELPLLLGCCTTPTCGLRLTNKPNPTLPTTLSKEGISDCLLAGYFLSTQDCLHLKQVKWLKNSSHLELIENGYNFLTKKALAKAWQDAQITKYSPFYPMSFSTISTQLLVQSLNYLSWPAIPALITKKKNLTKKHSITPRILTTAGIAKELLSVKLFELRALHESGIITIKDKSRLASSTPVELSNLFVHLSQHKVIPAMRELSKQLDILTYHDISMTELLIALVSGKLTSGYQPSVNLLSSIFVTPKNLKDFAKQTFKDKRGNKITLDKAIALTGLSGKELTKLRNANVLKKPDWYRPSCKHFCIFEDIIKLRNLPQYHQLTLKL